MMPLNGFFLLQEIITVLLVQLQVSDMCLGILGLGLIADVNANISFVVESQVNSLLKKRAEQRSNATFFPAE